MQEISYPIKLYGDSSALEKTIQGVEGKLNKLSSDEFLVVLKYDGNIKGLNAQIDKITALHPELPVDFKYNLNKKALEAEEKKLQSIINDQELNVLSVASDDNLKKQIQDIVSYIKKNTKELDDGVLFFEDEKKINTVAKKIRDLYSNVATAKEFFGSDWKPPKEFMDFISLIVNKAYQLENIGVGQGAKVKTELFNTKEIENQKAKIEAVKTIIDNIEKDMAGNNSINNNIAASNEQIGELLNKLEEIKKALEGIGERIPNTLRKPLEGVLDQSEITTWKNSFISALTEIKNGFDKILGKNNRLSEIFEGYNIGDNLHTKGYGELNNPERSLGISTKTGYIHGDYSLGNLKLGENHLSSIIVDDAFEKAKEIIDVFLHTHDTEVAQLSLPKTLYDENDNPYKTVGGDLIASFNDLKKGIKYQLVKAGNEIQLLNVKLLHDDYADKFDDSNIDKIKKTFASIVDDFKQEYLDEFYRKYLLEYIEEYNHIFEDPKLLSSFVASSDTKYKDAIINNISRSGLDTKFVDKFIEECKNEAYGTVDEILIATLNQFKGQLTGLGEIVDTQAINEITKHITQLAGELNFDDRKKLNSKVFESLRLNEENVYQLALRNNSGEIFKEALGDESFNINRYVQTWKNFKDFIKENPLELPEDKKDIFNLSNAQEYLQLIKEIEAELNSISEKRINVFNIKDNDQNNETPVSSDNNKSDIQNKFKDESSAVQEAVTEESASLDLLINKISEVCKAIQEKINKFEEEKDSVAIVVDSECKDLDSLKNKLTEIKGYIEQLYNQIGNLGNINFNGKVKIEGLSTLLSSLKEDKLDTKLTAMYTYLDDFAKAVNQIDFKSNLTEQLNIILSKSEELKNLSNILKKVNTANVSDVKKNVDSKNTENLNKYNAAYKVLINTEERFQQLKRKEQSGVLLTVKETATLSKLESDRLNATEQIETIVKATTGEILKQSSAAEEYATHADKIEKAFDAAAEAQQKLDRASLESGLQKEIEVIEKMALMPQKYTQGFRDELANKAEEARAAFQGTDEEIKNIIEDLKKTKENVPTDAFETTYLTLDKLGLRIQTFLSKNTAMSKELKEKFEEIYNTIQKYKDFGGDIDLKKILGDITKLEDKVYGLGQTGASTGKKLKAALEGIWRRDFARFFGLYDIIRYIRQISAEVIKVDTALTELRKVSDASTERLQQSLQKSADTAKELGAAINDVVSVTADWSRLGYSVDDAEELARVTTLFKNVGDNMSAEDASSFMISTLKGFEMEADQAMDIADKFNEVANNFAIDTAGIGDALQRSAAAFNAANTDLNESIALITATNAVVQNPESVGTMWKTVSARIRGAKAELEDMGEDTEGLVESTSKLRGLVKGMTGFDIMEDENTFKSIYDIIIGIGEKWQELNDIDRAALLEALAGKRAGNALAAALNNIDDLKASYETALNASGSAMREQENYEKSIQFSIDRLRATAQDLAQDFMKADVIKGTIDALNKILELLDKIVESSGSLVPILTAIATVWGGMKIHSELGGILDIINKLTGKGGSSKGGILEMLSTPVSQLVKNKKAIKETAETMTEVSGAAKKMADGAKAAAAETKALEGAAASAGMTLGTLIGILAAVGVAIYAGVKAWDYYTTTVEEVEEQIKQTEDKIAEIKSEIDTLNSMDDRNEYQNNRLALLREELKVQQDLLEIEEKRRLREKYDTDLADWFDDNNQNAKTEKVRSGNEFNPLSTHNFITTTVGNILSKWSEDYYKKVGADNSNEAQYGKLFYDLVNKWLGNASSTKQTFKNKQTEYNSVSAELDKARADLNKDIDNQYLLDRVSELENRQESIKKELDESNLALQEYLNATILQANEIEQDIESGKLTPEDAKQAQKNLDILNAKIAELNSELVSWQKESGTYDFFESYDFSKAIKNDEKALQELINSEEDNSILLNKIKTDYPDLITLMNQEGVTIEDLCKKYREFSEERQKAFSKKFSKSEMIDQITDLSDGFDKLDEIYADVFDKGSFDFTKLSTKKFNEAFKGLEDEYTEFIETVSANPTNLEATQEAFNKLTGAYIEHSGILEGVSEDTKELTINMLENMGVANAEEIVTQTLAAENNRLALEKEFVALKGHELKNATEAEINAFIDEKKYSDDARIALNQLALEKLNVNNNVLDFSGDIENLIGYVKAITGATYALSALKNADKLPTAEKEKLIAQANKEVEDAKNWKPKENNSSYFAPTNYNYRGADKTKDAIDKANKSAEESKEIIDWIEKALQRQEEQIARIDKVVNATYKNWSTRNSSLLSEIGEINKEIGMQTQAYQAYLRDAEAVPLAENYKKLVREGAMHAETITDKTLKKNIDHYTELYDKAIKAKDAVADLQAKIASLAKAKFDNVKSEFEGFTSEIEHFASLIDKELSHVENMGKIAGKSFYREKTAKDEQKLNELYKERGALVSALAEAEANGIEQGSADWIAMRNDIYSVDEAIADLTYELEDFKKKMKEVAKLNFDDLKSQFENAISIITGQTELTDAVVSMTQNAGYIASRTYYEALLQGSKENIKGLRKEYEKLSSTLADAMSAGDIEKYSEEWYQMNGDIMSVKKNLVDAANTTIEYANALRQIDWDVFDRGLDRISKLVDESEFFQELMAWDEKLRNVDTGELTAKGIARQGLMVQDYQAYMDKANAFGKEAEEIRKLIETDPKNTVLIDRYQELLSLQRESILAALKQKKSLSDLIREGYDELLKRIKKLIDEYTEALDKAKDYENSPLQYNCNVFPLIAGKPLETINYNVKMKYA